MVAGMDNPSEDNFLDVEAAGEAFDTGDKAVSKAMSVAWRTALIQTFFLATGDTEPDEQQYTMDRPRESKVKVTRQEKNLEAYDSLDTEMEGKTYAELGDLYRTYKPAGAGPAVLAKISKHAESLGNG